MSVSRRLTLSLAFALAALPAFAAQAVAFAGQDATVVVEHRTLDDAQTVGVPVDCGPGRRAIGGGVGTNGPSLAYDLPNFILADGPIGPTGATADTQDFDVPRYWYSAVTNAVAATEDYSFYAICSASSDATLQVTTVNAPDVESAPSVTVGEAVGCPPGQRAIGGGVGTTTDPQAASTEINTTQPLDSTGLPVNTNTGDTAISWYSSLLHERAARTYKLFAVCSPTSKATVRASTLTTTTYQNNAALCSSGTRAVGGGFGVVGATNPKKGMVSATVPTDSLGQTGLVDGAVARGWNELIDSTAYGSQTYRTYAMCESQTTGRRAAALRKCKRKYRQNHRKPAYKRCRARARRLPV